ncbi:11230_t:CDS:2 [Diversispora eburnea]|uniref:11230_t:CDS:1 n=1 Tax=Diversispora eburnea TaxID=1213867 RepID=A0A9N8ZSG0_9GLOM|nr:11230_t:CDS:2 [Diversispora eburnea]
MSKNENKDDLLSKKHEHNSSNNKQHISSENFDGKEFTLVDPSGTSHKAILFIENKVPEANSSDKKKNDQNNQEKDKQEHDRQENHKIKSEEAERKFRYEERKQNNQDTNKDERKSSDALKNSIKDTNKNERKSSDAQKNSIKDTNKVSIKRGQKYEEEEVETLPYSPYKTQLPPTFMAPSLTFPPTGIPTGVPPIGVPSTGFIPTNIQLPDQPIQQSLTVQPNISQNETADRSAIIALQQQIPGLTPNEAMATIQQYQQQGIPPEIHNNKSWLEEKLSNYKNLDLKKWMLIIDG